MSKRKQHEQLWQTTKAKYDEMDEQSLNERIEQLARVILERDKVNDNVK